MVGARSFSVAGVCVETVARVSAVKKLDGSFVFVLDTPLVE